MGKHLKRLAAPKAWMLDKLGGAFTIKSRSGPHKQSASLPITLFIRNRLKYALNAKEVQTILKQRLIKIDGKTRTDPKFPTGFMDVVQVEKTGPNAVPYLYTTDGRTIRYPDPIIKVYDSIQVDIASGKIQDTIKFDSGNLCMITGGRNTGRVGTIMSRERHPGSFDIVHVKDANGHTFATRIGYTFIIGKGNKPYISLPKGKGVKLSIAEERDKRLGRS